ncbi:hypothetical protein [Eikenella corrodens]|uniref:Uncharacterized protein n=1 Tax=Eikenella corrodens ATCC 23834 TaxID=546274 RepID=C0DUU5_EIKCO|nr:hypothetical protein [Eikenella corrodens]EEG24493.1 hypothetical protein EIKCOROL_01132 [Eikenella corrodens ATCC 23834]UAK75799.1 hypothetical protein K8P00_04495 [Eikenella corrodens]
MQLQQSGTIFCPAEAAFLPDRHPVRLFSARFKSPKGYLKTQTAAFR